MKMEQTLPVWLSGCQQINSIKGTNRFLMMFHIPEGFLTFEPRRIKGHDQRPMCFDHEATLTLCNLLLLLRYRGCRWVTICGEMSCVVKVCAVWVLVSLFISCQRNLKKRLFMRQICTFQERNCRKSKESHQNNPWISFFWYICVCFFSFFSLKFLWVSSSSPRHTCIAYKQLALQQTALSLSFSLFDSRSLSFFVSYVHDERERLRASEPAVPSVC